VKDVSFSYLIPAGQATSFKEAVHAVLRGEYFVKKQVLNNITFSVCKGDRVGIVGRNGSGKTTLLRLVCAITQPEKGSIQRYGTLAPVLSLGAGLEPELSGFENIRLLTALAGLPSEQEKAVQAFVADFAELDAATLRLQVKRYSSGMMARLSFAVAMAQNPDLLVVDEALAVGDAAFQQKCYDTLEKYCTQGGSLLLVSHAAGEIRRLCTRALLLDAGRLITDGSAEQTLAIYTERLGINP
jgi:ABC-type polysaccharide/polyol phosphate transport system ATPase subunit